MSKALFPLCVSRWMVWEVLDGEVPGFSSIVSDSRGNCKSSCTCTSSGLLFWELVKTLFKKIKKKKCQRTTGKGLARTGIEPATLALLAPRSNQLS